MVLQPVPLGRAFRSSRFVEQRWSSVKSHRVLVLAVPARFEFLCSVKQNKTSKNLKNPKKLKNVHCHRLGFGRFGWLGPLSLEVCRGASRRLRRFD